MVKLVLLLFFAYHEALSSNNAPIKLKSLDTISSNTAPRTLTYPLKRHDSMESRKSANHSSIANASYKPQQPLQKTISMKQKNKLSKAKNSLELLKRKKFRNNRRRRTMKHFHLPTECKKIKCPTVEDPVCAKFVFKTNETSKPFYIIMLNKCEIKYTSCHRDLVGTIVPMKNCHPDFDKKKATAETGARKRSKRSALMEGANNQKLNKAALISHQALDEYETAGDGNVILNDRLSTPKAIISEEHLNQGVTAGGENLNNPLTGAKMISVEIMSQDVTAVEGNVHLNDAQTAPTEIISGKILNQEGTAGGDNLNLNDPLTDAKMISVEIMSQDGAAVESNVKLNDPQTAPTAINSGEILSQDGTASDNNVNLNDPQTEPKAIISGEIVSQGGAVEGNINLNDPQTEPKAIVSGEIVSQGGAVEGNIHLNDPQTAPTAIISGEILSQDGTASDNNENLNDAQTEPKAIISGEIVSQGGAVEGNINLNDPQTEPKAIISGEIVSQGAAVEGNINVNDVPAAPQAIISGEILNEDGTAGSNNVNLNDAPKATISGEIISQGGTVEGNINLDDPLTVPQAIISGEIINQDGTAGGGNSNLNDPLTDMKMISVEIMNEDGYENTEDITSDQVSVPKETASGETVAQDDDENNAGDDVDNKSYSETNAPIILISGEISYGDENYENKPEENNDENEKPMYDYDDDRKEDDDDDVNKNDSVTPISSGENSDKNNENGAISNDVDRTQYQADCPTACPAQDMMVCAKCSHEIFKTFQSVCHMRMFQCHFKDEQLFLVARQPCVMSAPYISSSPPMSPKGHMSEPQDQDRILRYIRCREKGKPNDPYCLYHIGKPEKLIF